MTSSANRRASDIMGLIHSRHEVWVYDTLNEFHVKFHGPMDTPYYGGIWRIRVLLPDTYPFKSPSIGFINKMYHPNVDEASGTVCLDAINQAWTALYDLKNIFDTFLPQLLTYPNPHDPLNGEAAALYMHYPEEFQKKVQEYVKRYAVEDNTQSEENALDSSDSESSLSD